MTSSRQSPKISPARPLRLYEGNEIHLYTDGNYNIRNYILTYLRTPKKISLTDAPVSYTHLEEEVEESKKSKKASKKKDKEEIEEEETEEEIEEESEEDEVESKQRCV